MVDIFRAVRSAVMDQDLDEFEDGLDTRVGPKGVKLSGGQIQRTAAARMFVREPELLVFDDLSSALDVETERILWERVLKSLRMGGKRSNLPGRLPPPGGAAPGRPHHRAERRLCGSRRQAGRPAGDQ